MSKSRNLTNDLISITLAFTLLVSSLAGCGRTPAAVEVEPTKILPSNEVLLVQQIEQVALNSDRERQMWHSGSSQLESNLFFPEAFKDQPPDETKKQTIIEFYTFLDARDKVVRGIASQEESDYYYLTYIKVLQERLEVIDYLLANLAVDAQAGRKRIEGITDEKTRTEALLAEYEEILQSSTPPYSEGATRRHRVVCFDTNYGITMCGLESDLASTYVSGHWTSDATWETDQYKVSEAYDFLIKIDQVIRTLYGSTGDAKNTLAVCGDSNVYGLDTEGHMPAVEEIEGIQAGCDVLLAGLPSGSMGNATDKFISKMDAMVNNCVQIGNSPAIAPFIVAILASLVASLLSIGLEKGCDSSGGDARDAAQKEAEAHMAEAEAKDAAEEAERADSAALDAQGELGQAIQGAADVQNNPHSSEEDKAESMAEVDRAAQVVANANSKAQLAKERAEEAKAEAERKRKAAEDAKKKAGINSSAMSAPSASTDTPIRSCADMKARWESFKDECERTDSWDRPGTDCNDMVRRSSGCVDVRYLVPNPEDETLSCKRLSADIKDLMQGACELQQTVMSSVEPGLIRCAQFDPERFGIFSTSICGNPAAYVTEDQCIDLPTIDVEEDISQGNPPLPTNGGWTWGEMLFVDSLDAYGVFLDAPESQK